MIKTFRNTLPLAAALMLASTLFSTASADWQDVRCDIYPQGQDQASATLPCVFSQTQGHITITRSDGVIYDLLPQNDTPGLYRDADGQPVYRQKGLGDQGQIFQFGKETLYIYWDTAGLPGNKSADNDSALYSTDKYDATARLPCSMNAEASRQGPDCAAGVNRGPKAVQVTIMRKDGVERILQFDGDQVSSPGKGEIHAQLKGDEWFIRINKKESYRIPQAFLEGD